jgi:hypothetical protein
MRAGKDPNELPAECTSCSDVLRLSDVKIIQLHVRTENCGSSSAIRNLVIDARDVMRVMVSSTVAANLERIAANSGPRVLKAPSGRSS